MTKATSQSRRFRSSLISKIVSGCQKQGEAVLQILQDGRFPLNVGEDHSVAVRRALRVSEYFRRRNERAGLIWLDAHDDFNTPDSTPSGNVHGDAPGSALRIRSRWFYKFVCGFAKGCRGKLHPDRYRDLEKTDRENIQRSGIARILPMRDIDEMGFESSRKKQYSARTAILRSTASLSIWLD